MILTRDILAALVGFTARSGMKVAQEADWHYANLKAAMKGTRPIPRPRYPALLIALGLTPEGVLDPRKVFPARCDEVEGREVALTALRHLFPDGGEIRPVKVGHSIAALARRGVWRTYLVRDRSGLGRLALRVDVVPSAADPLGETLVRLGPADFEHLRLKVGPTVEATEEQCTGLWTGAMAPEAFDALMRPGGGSKTTWADVTKAAERLGLSPEDVLKLVLADDPV